MQIKTTTKLQTALAVKCLSGGVGRGCADALVAMLASLASRMPIGAGWQHSVSVCVCVFICIYIYVQANGSSLYKFQATIAQKK